VAQLDECLEAFRDAAKGELDPQLRWEIDRIHLRNRLPLFANDRTGADWRNEGEINERIP